MIRVILFDLDDTLYPEIDYVESGFKYVCKQIKKDFKTDCYDIMLGLFNEDKRNVYNRTLEKIGAKYDDEYINWLVELYRQHQPLGISFYSDVLPFLQELKKKNIKTGIITDGRIEGQEAKLQALNCYNLFDKIIITDSLGGNAFRKPHPKAYEIMKNFFNIEYSEMMYIGDNPLKDFAICTVYPIKVVRIFREKGFYTGFDPDKNSCKNIISCFSELKID